MTAIPDMQASASEDAQANANTASDDAQTPMIVIVYGLTPGQPVLPPAALQDNPRLYLTQNS